VFLERGGTNNPLASAEVRQALNYAINRTEITSALVGKYAQATSEWMPADGFVKSLQNYYSYNPTKAKQLLSEAGYPNGFTISVVDNTGQASDGTPADALTQAIASEWQAIGVTLNITSVPAAQLVADAFGGTYQSVLFSLGVNQYATYIPIFTTATAPMNQSKVDDPTIDTLNQEYLTSTNQTKYADQVSTYVTQQGWYLPVWAPETLFFANKSVKGLAFPILPNGLSYGEPPDSANISN
jgi:peptide/nickel transport system substrate-binding protein